MVETVRDMRRRLRFEAKVIAQRADRMAATLEAPGLSGPAATEVVALSALIRAGFTQPSATQMRHVIRQLRDVSVPRGTEEAA